MHHVLNISGDNFRPCSQNKFSQLCEKLAENLSHHFKDEICYTPGEKYYSKHYLVGRSHIESLQIGICTNRYDRPGLYIYGLYVVEEKEKSGIGRYCVRELIILCKKAGLKFIALKSLDDAEIFWVKMGFVKFPYNIDVFFPYGDLLPKEFSYKYMFLRGEFLRIY